jgi:translocation and assembly module TamB
MAEVLKRSIWRRHWGKLVLGVVLLFAIAGLLYLRSDSFKGVVRHRLVTELEQATGGRVELRALDWDLGTLEFVAHDLTIHGTEPPTQPPFVHVDRLTVRAKVFSWFERDFGLRLLRAEAPQVNVTVYPDGSTNIPKPRTQGTGRSPIATLFRLEVDEAQVESGKLRWNDRPVPFALDARGLHAEMHFVPATNQYDGVFTVETATAKYTDGKPLSLASELRFSLHPTTLDVTKFHLATTQSTLDASGKIIGFTDPKAQVTYRARLDLSEFRDGTGVTELHSGFADIQGTAAGTGKDYAATGRATVRGLDLRHGKMNILAANIAARYAADRNSLSLSNLVAQALGGTLQGSARLARDQGVIELTASGLDLQSVIDSLDLNVARGMQLAGEISGPLKAGWRGSPRNTVAAMQLAVKAPMNVAPGALPVHGDVSGAFSMANETLDLHHAQLFTPATALTASGKLGSRTAQLKTRFESTRIGEFQPIINRIAGPKGIPVDVAGTASFDGTIAGELRQPEIAGHAILNDFYSVLATSPGKEQRIHWDNAGADLQYQPNALTVKNGRLQRGMAVIDFGGSIALANGKLPQDAAFSAALKVRDAALADLQSIAGTSYPVTGTLEAQMNLTGTTQLPRGKGNLALQGGAIAGEPFHSLRADVNLDGKRVVVENFLLAQNGGRLTGSGTLDTGSKRFEFRANGSGFDLAHIKRLENPRAKFKGIASLEASGSGTLDQPILNGEFRIQNMSVNDEPFGVFAAQAVTIGHELRLQAHTAYKDSSFTLESTADLTGNFPARGRVTIKDFAVYSSSVAELPQRISGRALASGKADFHGSLKDLSSFTVEGEIPDLQAVLENVQLANEGPIRFRLDQRAVELQQFHIKGEGTNLQASGTLALNGDRQLNMRVQGAANMRLFQSFSRDLQSYGNVVLSTEVRGTVKAPRLEGQIQIQNAGLAFIDLPNGLSEINGTLIFDQNRLRIQSLSARTGGGLLNFDGYVAYSNGLYFDLTAKGDDIRLRYPEGVSSMANVDLHLAGTTRDSLLSGDVLVTKLGINPRFDFALYLARSGQPAGGAALAQNPMLANMRLDVHVLTTADLRVETSLAKIAGDADLRIRGTAAQPGVIGRANIVEGEVQFNGTKYNLERGDITFINPRKIEPVLDLVASARVREYDVTIRFAGSTDKLLTTYRSEPPLPTADIIALLAVGRTRDDALAVTTPQQSLTETAQNAILGQALDAAISNRVQKLFGVSRIKIDPQVGGPENATARITIEQQVNNNVTLTYITNLSSANQQIIQGEFNFTRDISLVIVRDQNGVLGFDVKVRQRKK